MDGDRELLERAARAAGYPLGVSGDGFFIAGAEPFKEWNPLTDDGDALRLAVKLRLALSFTDGVALCAPENGGFYVDEQAGDYAGDRAAATRRAIVRAAAKKGEEDGVA